MPLIFLVQVHCRPGINERRFNSSFATKRPFSLADECLRGPKKRLTARFTKGYPKWRVTHPDYACACEPHVQKPCLQAKRPAPFPLSRSMHIFLPLLLFLSRAIAEFISGGSFGRPTIGPYNNCSGMLTKRPTDLAIDTLPNISPDDLTGWERWDLTMYQSDLFLSMRWIQGDPASCYSVPANGTFELVAKFSNGTSYRTHTSGHKLTFTNVTGYSISIAGNTLVWDDSQSWFNTTLDVNGLSATFASQSSVYI